MKPRLAALSAVVASLALSAAVAAQDTTVPPATGPVLSAPVDAELESALTGRQVRVSSLRSKVIVVFYEDREHIAQNEELKGNLERFIADNHLEQQLTMQPMANADGYDYSPVNSLVRSGLAEGARRIHLDILIDWSRTLYAAPFSFVAGASNVAVIDRQGRITFRHAGLVGATERTALFRAIRQGLRS